MLGKKKNILIQVGILLAMALLLVACYDNNSTNVAVVPSIAAQITTATSTSTTVKAKISLTTIAFATSNPTTVNNTKPTNVNVMLTPQYTPDPNYTQSHLVIEKYYQSLSEGQYTVAFNILSTDFQKTISNPLKYETEQGVPDIKVVAVTPTGEPEPSDTRIVYEVLLNVQVREQSNSYWSDGNNERWLEMVQEYGNWHINQISNTPIRP